MAKRQSKTPSQFSDLTSKEIAFTPTPEAVYEVTPKVDDTLNQILLAVSSIEQSVQFLEDTAKKNKKYRGKLVALVSRMRPITRGGGMTELLKKALQRG